MDRPLFRVDCVAKLQPGARLYTLADAASAQRGAVFTRRIGSLVPADASDGIVREDDDRADTRLGTGASLGVLVAKVKIGTILRGHAYQYLFCLHYSENLGL